MNTADEFPYQQGGTINWYTCKSTYGHHLSVRATSAFAAIVLAEDLVGLTNRMTYAGHTPDWSVTPINTPPPIDCKARIHLSCDDCEPYGGGTEYDCDLLNNHTGPHRCVLALGTANGHLEWEDAT